MCGIVGIVGKKNYFKELKDLLCSISYRGYDSCGVSIVKKDGYDIYKMVGHPEGLAEDVDTEDSTVGFGHDRWASHGGISKENAHPHTSNDGKICLVHNGIIENYLEIKNFLSKNGFVFYSETDTEVIPNLIQYWYSKTLDIESALNITFKELKGAYAFVMYHLDYNGKIFVARLGSPICIGIEDFGAFYISSDIPSLPYFIKKTIALDNAQYAIIEYGSEIIIKNFLGCLEAYKIEEIEQDKIKYDKGNFNSFLEKEIFEQPKHIEEVLAGRVSKKNELIKLGGIESNIFKILKTNEFIFTGCGSAFYAAQIGAYSMELFAKIKSKAISAGELQYYNIIADDETTLVCVSQSGETADTIGCINNFKNKKSTIIGIVNVVSSTISRMVDCGIYIRSGKEASVAATKSVTNQILTMILMSAMLGRRKGLLNNEFLEIINDLILLPSKIDIILKLSNSIKDIFKIFKDKESMIIIGRDKLEPIAKEYALKIKEISYIHAEGYSGSEIKHGPLALINPSRPTIALVENNMFGMKMISNIKEITSRGGIVIGVFEEGCTDDMINTCQYNIIIPSNKIKIFNTITFLIVGQLISMHLAELRNCNIDRPINLAKSITIE
jgi:glucosamine--fructose-6-phosphate aminotransferase (isomerizing)